MPAPPRRREGLPLRQLVPNLVTVLGLCAGLTALRFTLQGEYQLAAALIIFAALLDGIDGLIARKLDAASRFGAELDSLADFVNFGVAPALLVYWLALAEAPDAAWTAPLVFTVCACLRLARFNANRDAPVTGKPHFVGVPAPAGALLGMLPAYLTFAGLAAPGRLPWLAAGWLIFVGLLMICRLRTPSPKGLHIPRERARWLFVGVALVAGLALSRLWLLMILVTAAYLATLLFTAAASRRRAAAPQPGA